MEQPAIGDVVSSLVRDLSLRQTAAVETAVRAAISQIPRHLWGLIEVEFYEPTLLWGKPTSTNAVPVTLSAKAPKVIVRQFRDVGPVEYLRRYRAIAAAMNAA